MADTTISGEITVGEGSTAQTVTPSTGGGSATTTQAGSTGQTQSTGGATTGGATTGGATTGGNSGADLAAGKSAFTATCGGCHTLKDAGTTGNVGPVLDSLAPLTAERVALQIKNAAPPMPAMLLTGQDAANVAAYVASVAGK